MWWPDTLVPSRHIVHVGRQRATVMGCRGRDIAWVGETSLDGIELANPDGLAARLIELAQAVPGRARWTLLLDSCWLPITTFPAIDQPWTPRELKALACHRWHVLYGGGPAAWSAQTMYLPGDQQATAYGMSARLRAQLQAFSKGAAGTVASIQPAVLWAFDHFSRVHKGLGLEATAWLWCEQDRCVAAIGRRGQLQVTMPALDQRHAGGTLEATLPRDAFDQVDGFFISGLEDALTLVPVAQVTLHDKVLKHCAVLDKHQVEATP